MTSLKLLLSYTVGGLSCGSSLLSAWSALISEQTIHFVCLGTSSLLYSCNRYLFFLVCVPEYSYLKHHCSLLYGDTLKCPLREGRDGLAGS